MARLDADHVNSPLGDLADHHDAVYFHHLRAKLRWQLLLALVLPLAVLSVTFHLLYGQTLRTGIDTHLKSVAEHKRNTVSLFLQERVANTRSAFAFEELPPSPERLQRALTRLRTESPAFVDVGLFDPQGKLVSYAGPFPQLVGKRYVGQQWYRRLQEGGRDFVISDVFMGFRGRPHFIIGVSKQVDGGRWILRTSVDPERFAAFVNSSLLMKQVEALIVNRSGARQTLTASVSRDKHLPAPRRDPAGETTVAEVTVKGTIYLAAYAWLTESDWALVVRIPRDIAYAPMRAARLKLAGLMVVILALIVVLVLRSTGVIVGWLQRADDAKEDLRRQLFNAAKLASVGEMAAGVAHEINNPLAIIYEEAGMMRDLLDPELGSQQVDLDEFRERLQAITEATLRGRGVTSKLLAFARQHDPDPTPTEINPLVDKVLEIKARELELCDIEVAREFASGLPLVLVNSNQMEQVLLNLLNNARDAISGPGRITLRTAEAEDGFVRIDIEDTGCGMTAEQLEKVFFPFFTTKGVGKGTGLGLSISFGIVKALGGRLEVVSEVDEGTSFSVFLPVADGAAKRRRKGRRRRSKRKSDGRRAPPSVQ